MRRMDATGRGREGGSSRLEPIHRHSGHKTGGIAPSPLAATNLRPLRATGTIGRVRNGVGDTNAPYGASGSPVAAARERRRRQRRKTESSTRPNGTLLSPVVVRNSHESRADRMRRARASEGSQERRIRAEESATEPLLRSPMGSTAHLRSLARKESESRVEVGSRLPRVGLGRAGSRSRLPSSRPRVSEPVRVSAAPLRRGLSGGALHGGGKPRLQGKLGPLERSGVGGGGSGGGDGGVPVPHVNVAAEDSRRARIASPVCACVREVAGVSLRGHNPLTRKTNQDAMVLVEHSVTGSLLVAVFDGHGVQGHDVSGYVARTFVTLLLQDSRFCREPVGGREPDICGALADSLLAAEAAMLQEGSIDASLSGSTAVAAVLRGSQLWAIGVGDSRAVLSVPGGGSIQRPDAITTDHKPDTPSEKRRILAAGGRVMATRNRLAPHIIGPARVWLRDVPAPGLAMSRSLGDLVAKAAGVVSTPDRIRRAIVPDAAGLILASDGLWDFVSNEEVISAANATNSAQEAADNLMRIARARWIDRTGGADDITVVVVKLQPPSKPEDDTPEDTHLHSSTIKSASSDTA